MEKEHNNSVTVAKQHILWLHVRNGGKELALLQLGEKLDNFAALRESWSERTSRAPLLPSEKLEGFTSAKEDKKPLTVKVDLCIRWKKEEV